MKKIAGILILLAAILAAGILLFGGLDFSGNEEKTTENKQELQTDEGKNEEEKPVMVNIGSLKGPTSMGLVSLMKESESRSEKDSVNYTFTMETDASVLLPKMIKGELDIALLPANVAATLYQKMEGKLKVIDINTLGVLYMVSADSSINEMSKLKGKTIYLTGKGTTPDYVLQYLLKENGITDVTLEYKSEATEVAAILAAEPESIGVLPQPFVTAACIQNDKLGVLFDFNEEWEKVAKASDNTNSKMVTGVTVVRSEFLEEHPEAVKTFLDAHKKSADFAVNNVEETAKLVAEYGIIEKAPVAQKALTKCNITCITGTEMKEALSSYLAVLHEFSAQSVGGKMPAEDFYYAD